MGNPTGFLQHTRQLPQPQAVSERLQHDHEFVGRYSNEQLNQQSGRCMNCGVPFCHNGCPLGNIIPEFNDAVYREQWQEAYEILASTNNFPEFTGRICPAPCESACVLGINQPPVAIEEIEKHIIETAFERGYVKPKSIWRRTGKKVAVVGSGPAGLAVAAQLNYAGHDVVVFERDAEPGGLLRYGIPNFKLEKNVVARRIQLMEAEGVVFQCNTMVGQTISTPRLIQDFDAVVLTVGATVPRDLTLPGRHLNGVHFAMEYLAPSSTNTHHLNLLSKGNVIVIGGGDTGSDCVGTANRKGARTVLQFELMPEPPRKRTEQMPWPVYPMLYKVSSSHEEGCERLFAIRTTAFLGDENGQLNAVEVENLAWKSGADGRPAHFEPVAGSRREIPCDLVLLALGFLHPEHNGLLTELGVELDERGNIRATETAFSTNIDKVFVAGDARRGQSLVVWAISEGRECARKVDEYLMGFSNLASKDAIGWQ